MSCLLEEYRMCNPPIVCVCVCVCIIRFGYKRQHCKLCVQVYVHIAIRILLIQNYRCFFDLNFLRTSWC